MDIDQAIANINRDQDSENAALQQTIAGALFDFLGFLTTLDEPITLSAAHETSPRAVDLIVEWAALRGLSITSPDVLGWQERIR